MLFINKHKRSIKNLIIDLIFKIYRKYFYYKIVNNDKFQQIIKDEFHKLYYYNSEKTWRNTSWLNIPTFKCPLDLWIYQEIIIKNKPDIIIELGTARGGSSLFLAHICELINRGKIITVDIKKIPNRPLHKRIIYLHGSSISKKIFSKINSLIKKTDRIMVILDSNHYKLHVIKELMIYSRFVTKGCYLIIEDTHLFGHPVRPYFPPGGGPMEAMEDFLNKNKNFIVDKTKEKFYLTFFNRGFLKRVN